MLPRVDLPTILGYDRIMSLDQYLNHWCQFRGITVSELAEKTGLSDHTLHSVQCGAQDVPMSVFEDIAEHLNIPAAWLHYNPHIIQRLWNDPDEENSEFPDMPSFDPILERILQASREYQDIFVMLTSILHHGDPKLIRAAQVSLQSLLKQARPTTLPWGSRPPGHFEPPSD